MRVKMICASLLLTSLWCGAAAVRFEPGTPVLAQPAPDAPRLFVINRQVEIETSGKKLSVLTRHPLGRYYTFYRIQLDADTTSWASPELRVVGENGQLRLTSVYRNSLFRKLLLAATIGALAAIGGFWLHRRVKRRELPPLQTRTVVGMSIAFLVLLRWLLLLILVMGGHNIIASASDDPGYFETAMGLLDGDFSGPWRFTIGHGFLYLPFILALGANEFYDIAVPFAWFAGFVLMPGCLAMTYLIVRKLTGSQHKGFFVALLWTVIPFFYFHFEVWDKQIFKSYFALPQTAICFRFYRNIINLGFNAMSDTPSTFFVLLCILLAVYLPAKLKSIVLISGIYGFACLIRINNILFAPLIAWLFWLHFNAQLLNWRFLFRAMITAIGAFLAVFGWQLVINQLHFGHFFTFPYVLHGGANDGFLWLFVNQGIRYLGGTNHAYWALGTTGLIFISDRRLRVTLILWSIPVILFFYGYPCTYCDAHRFIMTSYSALLTAVVCADIWDKSGTSEKLRLTAMLCVSLLLVCPSAYFWEYQMPWDLQLATHGAAIAKILNYTVPIVALLITISFYRNRRLLMFSILFMLLYFPGNPFAFAVIFCLLLLWAVGYWSVDIALACFRPKIRRVKNRE